MTSERLPSFLPTTTLLLLPLLYYFRITLAEHIPIRYKIPSKQTECLYEHFKNRDVVTFSVFVVHAHNNGRPRATITFEGPVADNEHLTPQHLHRDKNVIEGEELQPAGRRGRIGVGREIRTDMLSYWPHISGAHRPRAAIVRKFKVDWTHSGESEDAAAARADLLRQTHEEFQRHSRENAGGGGEDDEGDGGPSRPAVPPPLHTVPMAHIMPYEETVEIIAHGYYRLCVTAADARAAIEVEMDLRSADKMKGIDPGTGHVYTYERREYLDEQIQYFGSPMGDGGVIQVNVEDGHKPVTDGDFDESKIKLQHLHELTSEIMKSQHHRMQRIRAHDADARRGAAELARSSKVETLLFVIITCVQVYTVHKWLLGNLLLGK